MRLPIIPRRYDFYKRDISNAQEALRNAYETASAPQRNSGKAALDRRNWDKALADFTEIIRRFPNYAEAYSYRAQAYFSKRKYKEAREDVDKALQLNPNNQAAKDLDAELKKRRF